MYQYFFMSFKHGISKTRDYLYKEVQLDCTRIACKMILFLYDCNLSAVYED